MKKIAKYFTQEQIIDVKIKYVITQCLKDLSYKELRELAKTYFYDFYKNNPNKLKEHYKELKEKE